MDWARLQGEAKMDRRQLLAAEIYAYSYDNYHEHLGANPRFDRDMPEAVDILESAANEAWPIERVADALRVDTDAAKKSLLAPERARKVVDAENPAESFRRAVRQSIEAAVEDGLSNAESIDQLTIQICYRAADLGYMLKQIGNPLSRYSRHLRREPDVTYHEGYFDEED